MSRQTHHRLAVCNDAVAELALQVSIADDVTGADPSTCDRDTNSRQLSPHRLAKTDSECL